MGFGMRLGPFWASTGTRRSRRRSQSFHGMICDEDGKAPVPSQPQHP